VIALLLFAGTFFALVAALGVVRMPDIYMRLSAASKASTLGASCILAAVALYFANTAVTGKVVAIIAFTLLTAPVAAHMLGRAAYFSGEPLWYRSKVDDLNKGGTWLKEVAQPDVADQSDTPHQKM
jgi:multicomponent Na+:H+ antiporter subunit G